MNLSLVEKIADAVLYEGYILYPYRPSAMKNRRRFNFGVLVPSSYSLAQGGESWSMQTECLLEGNGHSTLNVKLRFLHLRLREIYEVADCGGDAPSSGSQLQAVEALEVDGQLFQTWQEAVEREVSVTTVNLRTLAAQPRRTAFSFPASLETEMLHDANGKVAGAVVWKQQPVAGAIELRAEVCEAIDELHVSGLEFEIRKTQLFKVTARVLNLTALAEAGRKSRDEVLPHSLVSAHTILGVRGGEFVSLLEPPEEFGEAAASCQNIGTWPVLAGEPGARDVMLSSPIILYDYPQVAPESLGDLFDGSEIDELLTLRILALTDEEKREMRDLDERTRQILERTEALTAEQLSKLHGAARSPHPTEEQTK